MVTLKNNYEPSPAYNSNIYSSPPQCERRVHPVATQEQFVFSPLEVGVEISQVLCSESVLEQNVCVRLLQQHGCKTAADSDARVPQCL